MPEDYWGQIYRDNIGLKNFLKMIVIVICKDLIPTLALHTVTCDF